MRTILDTSVLISSLIKGWWRQFADALHPNLILTSFFQYDTQAQSIGNNFRLRWTVRPGNDLFIVWNRNWQRLTLTPNDVNIVPAKDSLTVKLRWTFRQ